MHVPQSRPQLRSQGGVTTPPPPTLLITTQETSSPGPRAPGPSYLLSPWRVLEMESSDAGRSVGLLSPSLVSSGGQSHGSGRPWLALPYS